MTTAEPGPAPLLEIAGLSVNYGGIHALEALSLVVHPGEVVTLIGANGAGKSTTLRSISRLLPVRRGRIVYGGQEIGRLRPDEVVRLGIAQVPEGRRMLARQSVLDNLLLGAYTRSDSQAIQVDVEQQFQRWTHRQRVNGQGRKRALDLVDCSERAVERRGVAGVVSWSADLYHD